jgi:hypothetical protein
MESVERGRDALEKAALDVKKCPAHFEGSLLFKKLKILFQVSFDGLYNKLEVLSVRSISKKKNIFCHCRKRHQLVLGFRLIYSTEKLTISS